MFEWLITIICVAFLCMFAWFIVGIFVDEFVRKIRNKNIPWHKRRK